MRTFLLGLTVGLGLSGIAAWGGDLYDRQGNVKAPAGSQAQLDYFRNRGALLDLQHLRQQADRERFERAHPSGRPCQ